MKHFLQIDELLIRHLLTQQGFTKSLKFYNFLSIDSTNRFLKELKTSPELSICCAEQQTQGRGRFGRQWLSPFGENIYFSSRWQLTGCLATLSSLSLVVGLAVLASFQDHAFRHELQLKWPNDILWGEKKLAGILIEINAEPNNMAQVIIGIGLNVNTATHLQPLAGISWCSLYEITGHYFDRNPLIANLINTLDNYLTKFLDQGFSAFQCAWQKVDYLYNKLITVSQGQVVIQGLSLGVNELGQLCLRDNQGIMHYLSSGESSLQI